MSTNFDLSCFGCCSCPSPQWNVNFFIFFRDDQAGEGLVYRDTDPATGNIRWRWGPGSATICSGFNLVEVAAICSGGNWALEVVVSNNGILDDFQFGSMTQVDTSPITFHSATGSEYSTPCGFEIVDFYLVLFPPA